MRRKTWHTDDLCWKIKDSKKDSILSNQRGRMHRLHNKVHASLALASHARRSQRCTLGDQAAEGVKPPSVTLLSAAVTWGFSSKLEPAWLPPSHPENNVHDMSINCQQQAANLIYSPWKVQDQHFSSKIPSRALVYSKILHFKFWSSIAGNMTPLADRACLTLI